MNYILLFPDELRAESLGCYGHPLIKTPNIDRLAAEGTIFEENYTAHPVCGPSRACLATGWYPHVDGKRTFYFPTAKDPNLFAALKDSGMTLAHAGKDDMFDHDSMGEIFDEFLPFYRKDIVKDLGLCAVPEAPASMLYPSYPDAAAERSGDARTTADAVDFIRRHAEDEKPFFLMVSWMYPHPPYVCPESFYHMYDPEQVPMRRGSGWMENKPDFYHELRKFRGTEHADAMLFRRINAVYLGMISYIDMLTGRIVDALKQEGIYEDTTIIFCSDHGDFAGDAGQLEKWPSDMSDMITRVPLIIRKPGAPAGNRVKTPTQSIDILPTILDERHYKPSYLQFGVSLLPQIEGTPGDEGRAVYTEGGYDTDEPWCFEPTCFKGTCLEHPFSPDDDYYPKVRQQQEEPDTVCRVLMQRFQDWKLVVRTNGQNEMYHMTADPWEQHNLYGQSAYADIQHELTDRMLCWLIHTSDVVPEDADWRSGKR